MGGPALESGWAHLPLLVARFHGDRSLVNMAASWQFLVLLSPSWPGPQPAQTKAKGAPGLGQRVGVWCGEIRGRGSCQQCWLTGFSQAAGFGEPTKSNTTHCERL